MELKNDNLIKLSDVKVVFCDMEDKGFGKSITIDCTDENIRKAITDWYATNKIGKNAGVPNIKKYTSKTDGTESYNFTFKIGKFTQFSDGKTSTQNSSEFNLHYGDTISLIAKAYTFEHPKFGTGVTQSLNCVVLRQKAPRKSAIEMLIEE